MNIIYAVVVVCEISNPTCAIYHLAQPQWTHDICQARIADFAIEITREADYEAHKVERSINKTLDGLNRSKLEVDEAYERLGKPSPAKNQQIFPLRTPTPSKMLFGYLCQQEPYRGDYFRPATKQDFKPVKQPAPNLGLFYIPGK